MQNYLLRRSRAVYCLGQDLGTFIHPQPTMDMLFLFLTEYQSGVPDYELNLLVMIRSFRNILQSARKESFNAETDFL